MIKKIIIALLLLLLIGVATVTYQWFKPHKKVENTKGIIITAEALFKEYSANEQTANAKYLNKAIEVSGVVSEIDKNQDGGLMIILDTGDPMGGVQCAMRDKGITVIKGSTVIIKGFCSGSGITGVSLTDCIINEK